MDPAVFDSSVLSSVLDQTRELQARIMAARQEARAGDVGGDGKTSRDD